MFQVFSKLKYLSKPFEKLIHESGKCYRDVIEKVDIITVFDVFPIENTQFACNRLWKYGSVL